MFRSRNCAEWRTPCLTLACLGVLMLPSAARAQSEGQVKLEDDIADESAGGLLCYRITTPSATYYLEKVGAGLSSLLDKDGNDWLGFKPDEGSGSTGEYRGFPNAVYKQDGSFFHPRNAGTDPSETKVIKAEPNHVAISAVSGNGNWQARWDFYPTHCTFTMQTMPQDYSYWILYEGVPGGQYDDSDWWMTSADLTKHPMTTNHEEDIPDSEWIAFGDQDFDRAFVMYHHEDDSELDRFYQMRHEMTVFGFGRDGLNLLLDTVPQSFSIAIVETTEHSDIAEFVNGLQD